MGRRAWGAAVGLALLPFGLAAQVRPDTVRVPVPPEARAPDTVPKPPTPPPDSLQPAPLPAPWRSPATTQPALGRWSFAADSLRLLSAESVAEVVADVPGVLTLRGGGWGHAVAVGPWGLGGARWRVEEDGWVLDPLVSPGLDPFLVPLLDVEHLVIERTATEVRLRVDPYRLPSREPASRIDGLTESVQDGRALRALFARPIGPRATVWGTYAVANSRGAGRRDELAVTAATAHVALRLGRGWALQLDTRALGVDRRVPPDLGWPREHADRTSTAVRIRRDGGAGRLELGVAAERLRPRSDDPRPAGQARQLWLRARLDRGGVWAEAEGRARALEGAALAPTAAAVGRGGLRVGHLGLEGEARWEEGSSVRASSWRVVGRWGGRWAVVGELEGGATWTIRALGSAAPQARAGQRTGARVGVEAVGRWGEVAAAWVRARVDSVFPWGLAWDTAAPALPGAAVQTLEGLARWRLGGGFALEARGTAALGAAPPVGPRAEVRGALVYHRLHYTGNLEPRLWAEVGWRASGRVPAVPAAPRWVDQPGYVRLAVGGVVRIIDVHLHLELDNGRNDPTVADLPRRPRGARGVVGVRWIFRN